MQTQISPPEPTATEKPVEPKVAKYKLEQLEKIAKEMLAAMKLKYAKEATSKALEIAATAAFNIWHKAAEENIRTGEAQLQPFNLSGPSSLERYFCQRLPEKR